MRITFSIFAAISALWGIGSLSDARAQAAPTAECKAIVDFLETQHKAGIELGSYSKDEIHWALEYSSTKTCKPIPDLLRKRMRGEPVIIPHHTRMNCHLAIDYLMMEAKQDERFITETEKQWARDYYSNVEANELCPAVPSSLALRARGHTMQDVTLKAALAAAMDKAGDADAALEIAMAYFYGTLVGKNAEKGYSYLVKAQQMGSPQAEWELANLYISGKLEGSKPEGAIPFLERAASGGVVPAMTALATMYADNGYGVKMDRAAATRYYGMAAGRGDLNALILYAERLFKGEGVKADPQQAMELVRTAALSGAPDAMTLLASFTLRDKKLNLIKSEGEVWYWLDRARDAGNPTALAFYKEKAGELEAIYQRAKFPPPQVRVCPRVLSCDVYIYNNGRERQKICSEGPDWRACRTVAQQ